MSRAYVEDVKGDKILDYIRSSKGYLLVHVTSYDRNCPFCAASNPAIDDIATRYHQRMSVARVHWEPWQNMDRTVLAAFGFKDGFGGVPFLVVFKNGNELWRLTGWALNNSFSQKLANQLDKSLPRN